MSSAPFPAGTMFAEGTLYADPKQIGRDSKNTVVSLKTKINYREKEDEELDAFFIDVIVSGSTADNILKSGWKKYDRIFFLGDFKGNRWERKLDEGGVNEEQSISVFAKHIGASPRFTEVHIEAQDFNGGDGEGRSSRRRDNDEGGRRSRRDDDEPRSSRRRDDDDEPRRSRRGDDDEEPRSSRRSSDDEDEAPARRSSRRARSTDYGDED